MGMVRRTKNYDGKAGLRTGIIILVTTKRKYIKCSNMASHYKGAGDNIADATVRRKLRLIVGANLTV